MQSILGPREIVVPPRGKYTSTFPFCNEDQARNRVEPCLTTTLLIIIYGHFILVRKKKKLSQSFPYLKNLFKNTIIPLIHTLSIAINATK